MKYIAMFLMLCAGYYCLTYGISLWNCEKNKLGGFGAIMAALIGIIVPILYILFRK
jgi:hypothetical protein